MSHHNYDMNCQKHHRILQKREIFYTKKETRGILAECKVQSRDENFAPKYGQKIWKQEQQTIEQAKKEKYITYHSIRLSRRSESRIYRNVLGLRSSAPRYSDLSDSTKRVPEFLFHQMWVVECSKTSNVETFPALDTG